MNFANSPLQLERTWDDDEEEKDNADEEEEEVDDVVISLSKQISSETVPAASPNESNTNKAMAGLSLSTSETPFNPSQPGPAKESQLDDHGSGLLRTRTNITANQSDLSQRTSKSISLSPPSQISAKSLMPPPSRPSSSSLLSPISAHSARQPRMTSYGPGSTESSQDAFPMINGPQILSTAPGVRRKVPLGPGHSALDWAKLKSSGTDLRGGINGTSRLTPSMLAQHRTKEDCWMAIQGKVYNVTPYLKYHPGGVSQLMRGAGRDATELYLKIHPWVNIDVMLDKCFLGYLVPELEYN
ncbi:hypothetical protein BJ742DRAFT_760375 [Cladochytrium replicatum]|nr:hypothetical protein BJ742DRAFT_760375 [Cladochytrium replicatum]